MRAVALLVSLAMSTGACFPHNEHHQTLAKLTEGGLVVAGVALLFAVNTGADCDAMLQPGESGDSCHTKATVLGDIGLGLILTGLIGFIATVSSAEDAKPTPTTVTPKAADPTPPAKPAEAPKPTQTIATPPQG